MSQPSAVVRPGTGADILLGIGGTPEGVITAAALKCMGGEQLGRLWPRNERERRIAIETGYDLTRVLTADDLIQSGDCFFATGEPHSLRLGQQLEFRGL